MVDRVLVPVDGSEQADIACEFVFDTFPDATLVLLHVVNPAEASYGAQVSIPTASEEWYENEKARAQREFDDIVARADERGIETETVIEVGKPTTFIVDFAEENDIDHVVMGSHGRKGVSRILLGSVAETVVRRSAVPVTVVR
ncbi:MULTISPECIES: universal stress protein [Salinibaculum]|uniref:universal stress protein n=1 Tax=Salinibaculum TaxID=2732368 RepID=UPI0030CF5CDB